MMSLLTVVLFLNRRVAVDSNYIIYHEFNDIMQHSIKD